MVQKIISIMMVPLLFFYTLLPAAFGARNDQTFQISDLKNLRSLSDYINYVQDHGAPSFDTDTFIRTLAPTDMARKILHGQVLNRAEEAYLDVQLEEMISDFCTYLAENTGFDLERLLTHVPNMNGLAEFGAEVLHVNTTALRERLYEMRDEAFREGDKFKGNMLYLFGAYFSVIKKVDIVTVPASRNPDEVEVKAQVTYLDGYSQLLSSDIFINTVTGEASGRKNDGMAGLGFNCMIPEMVVYAIARAEGFDKMSDELFNGYAIKYANEYGLDSVKSLTDAVGFCNVQKRVLNEIVRQYVADNGVPTVPDLEAEDAKAE